MQQSEQDQLAERLFHREIISEEQLIALKAYRSLGIFSLRGELSFLLYLGVLLFTSGAGILVYKNIDSIGHTAILTLLLALIGVCFYVCFKKAPEFRWEETAFESPTYDYLVLLGTILSCIFIGYIQVQYEPFGKDISITTLLSALLALYFGYFFDNKSALSIGITGLIAFIGITITPRALIANEIYTTEAQTYTGILLALVFVLWAEYAERRSLKKHFNLVILTFAQHLAGICCLKGMLESYWLAFVPIMAGVGYYFYRKSYKIESVSIFVFTLIYAYIGLNIVLYKIIELLNWIDMFMVFALLYPIYLIGSIFLFIRMIKKFNKETDDSNR